MPSSGRAERAPFDQSAAGFANSASRGTGHARRAHAARPPGRGKGAARALLARPGYGGGTGSPAAGSPAAGGIACA